MKKTVERFAAVPIGPAGVSIITTRGRKYEGRICVSSDLATEKEIDYAIDGLREDLERVRRDAKAELKQIQSPKGTAK